MTEAVSEKAGTGVASAARGFTLIEVLVALGVLGIAVVALLKVQGESAAAASAARERLLAQIVAENMLVEAIAAPEAPVAGTTSGETQLAGRAWAWTQVVAVTGDADIARVDVAVRAGGGETVLATLAGFRERRP